MIQILYKVLTRGKEIYQNINSSYCSVLNCGKLLFIYYFQYLPSFLQYIIGKKLNNNKMYS